MAKLKAEAWELSRAQAFATLSRQVTTEGIEGAENVAPLLTSAQYGDIDAAVRSGAYAMFRALTVSAPWQTLALAAGWTSFSRPEWRIDPLGYVEFRGVVAGGSGLIAVLPVQARPTRSDRFLVAASGGAGTAHLDVSTLGELSLAFLGTGANAGFITLSGVRWHLS